MLLRLWLKEVFALSKKNASVLAKQHRAGWIYLAPASLLIVVMSFWPMIQAFLMSLKTG